MVMGRSKKGWIRPEAAISEDESNNEDSSDLITEGGGIVVFIAKGQCSWIGSRSSFWYNFSSARRRCLFFSRFDKVVFRLASCSMGKGVEDKSGVVEDDSDGDSEGGEDAVNDDAGGHDGWRGGDSEVVFRGLAIACGDGDDNEDDGDDEDGSSEEGVDVVVGIIDPAITCWFNWSFNLVTVLRR